MADEPNEITIQHRVADDIYHVSDTMYGSSTTTGNLRDALDWATSALSVGQPILLKLQRVDG